MPTIELNLHIAAPMSKVVQVARETERYPEFMPDVKSLTILEKSADGTYLKTSWAGRIPQFGLTVRWTQEETWTVTDGYAKSDFKQIEGDYDKMEGWWKFSEQDGGCKFECFLDYEYNVPLLGPLVKKVIRHIVEQNLLGIMNAIAKRAKES